MHEKETHIPLRYSKVSWAIDDNDKKGHLVDDWPDPAAPSAIREKVPSSVSYNSKGELCGWGYSQGEHTTNVKWFKEFVSLTNIDDLESKLQSHCGDPAVHLQRSSFAIVSDYLRCIWNHTKVHIIRHRGDRWESLYSPSVILTVPEHWSSSCRQRMITIALHAGLPHSIKFVSEPKATALALLKGMVPTEDIWSAGSKDIIIVCDVGTSTIVSMVSPCRFLPLTLSFRTSIATESPSYGHSNLKNLCAEEVCKLLSFCAPCDN